jgi:hypothetical protein
MRKGLAASNAGLRVFQHSDGRDETDACVLSAAMPQITGKVIDEPGKTHT